MNEDGLTALDARALLGLDSGREAHVQAERFLPTAGISTPSAPSVLHPLFFNRKPVGGTSARQFEKPWHRIALHLLAQGEQMKTVAELCGKVPESVYQLSRTPWFQTMLAEEIAERSGKGMVELFQSDVAMARAVENELLANPQTPPTVRASLAKTKIERVYGKPKQLVEFDNITSSENPVAEAEELERSLLRDSAALGISLPSPSGQS